MQLTDILELNCVKVPLEATDKTAAIKELVDLLDQNVTFKDYDAVCQAVMEREAIRSTGVGQGFAIPHGKTHAVDRIYMAVGKLSDSIDFNSIDHQKVTMIVLLVSPLDQTGPHIHALAKISRLMTDQKTRNELWACNSALELYQLICNYHFHGPGQGTHR